VRYRLMATYRGSPFEAGIGPTDDDIVLFAACPPPEELGFEPATGHWRKQLRISDVQAVWESRPVGTFRGERCMVLDDLGDRLHIGYLGHDGYKAEQLGYWQVDRGVFELVAPRAEVSDVFEERTEYPRSAPAGYQPAAGRPDAQAAAVFAEPAESAGFEPMPYVADTGSWLAPPGSMAPPAAQAHQPVPDDTSGVALPIAAEAPLPLEAAAMRAASAARRSRQPVAQRSVTPPVPAGPAEAAPGRVPASSRQRRAARRRMAIEPLFADLAERAGIPADSYSVGGEVEGALCLVQTDKGFAVFHSVGGVRHELQTFTSEEAACFYLFGVLAAEAVRTGVLVRVPAAPAGSAAGAGQIAGLARPTEPVTSPA
jgi:hypothetical protein